MEPSLDGPSREPSELEKQNLSHSETPTRKEEIIGPLEAKRILRKIDWRIIPLLQFLYMLTFLDRVNIGNARLWNLERDLKMSGYDYNIVVLSQLTSLTSTNGHMLTPIVFYIPYIILEIPSNYFFNRVEPRKFMAIIIMGWGCMPTSQYSVVLLAL